MIIPTNDDLFNGNIGVHFKQIIIPAEIIFQFFEFSKRDITLLNGLGCVNKTFALCAQKSWRTIEIKDVNKLQKVPLNVLRSVKIVKCIITEDFIQQDVDKFKNNLKNVWKLILGGAIEKFLYNNENCYDKIGTIIFDNVTSSKYFWCYYPKCLRKHSFVLCPKMFPKLTHVIFPAISSPNEMVKTKCYDKLEFIRITPSFLKNGLIDTKRTIKKFPYFFSKMNLKGFLSDILVSRKGMIQICNNKKLETICYQIENVENINVLSEIVFPQCVLLNEVKLNFSSHTQIEKTFVNYLKNIKHLTGLKLLILQFNLKNKYFLKNCGLQKNLQYLNGLSELKRIIIDFRFFIKSGKVNGDENFIASFFCKHNLLKKAKYKDLITLKCGNTVIKITQKKKSC